MEKGKYIYGEVEGVEWIRMWSCKDKYLEIIVDITGYPWIRWEMMGDDGDEKISVRISQWIKWEIIPQINGYPGNICLKIQLFIICDSDLTQKPKQSYAVIQIGKLWVPRVTADFGKPN
jgi:hypothetical protein